MAGSGVSRGLVTGRGRPLVCRGPPWSTFCPCPQKALLPAGRQSGTWTGPARRGAVFTGNGQATCTSPASSRGRFPPALHRAGSPGAAAASGVQQAGDRHFQTLDRGLVSPRQGPHRGAALMSSVNQTAEPLQQPPAPAEGALHARQPRRAPVPHRLCEPLRAAWKFKGESECPTQRRPRGDVPPGAPARALCLLVSPVAQVPSVFLWPHWAQR